MRVYLSLQTNQKTNDSNSSLSLSENYQNLLEDDSFQSYQIIEYPSDPEDSIVQPKEEKDGVEEEASDINPKAEDKSEVLQDQHDSLVPHSNLITSESAAIINSPLLTFQQKNTFQEDLTKVACRGRSQNKGEENEIGLQTDVLGKRKAISLENTNTKERNKDTTLSSSKAKPSVVSSSSLPVSKRAHSSSIRNMGLPQRLGDYYSSQLKSSDSADDSGTHFDPELVARQQSYPEREDIDNECRSDHTSESFILALKKRGLEVVEQEGDGNCLFRAVSLQVYGDSDSHMDVRRRCLDFMVSSFQFVSKSYMCCCLIFILMKHVFFCHNEMYYIGQG